MKKRYWEELLEKHGESFWKMRFRSYSVVWNNYPSDYLKVFDNLKTKHSIIGKEVGEQGTPHLQCGVSFENGKTFNSTKKIFKGCDVDIAKNYENIISYCKKGEQPKEEWEKFRSKGENYGKNADYLEEGSFTSQEDKGRKGKEYWDAQLNYIKNNDLEKVDSRLQITHTSNIDKIRYKSMINRKLPRLDKFRNLWIYGAKGAGKSHLVRELLGDYGFYEKDETKWWCGYNDEENVYIEDFGETKVKIYGDSIKNWTDIYPTKVIIRNNAGIIIRPKRFLVTANYRIIDLYYNDLEGLAYPIERRFIHVKVVDRKYYIDDKEVSFDDLKKLIE